MLLRPDPTCSADDTPEVCVNQFPCVLGRSHHCDIRLENLFVSRRQCRFTRSGSQVWVQDLESRNGTFVNGENAVSPLLLQDGDELRLGPLCYSVVLTGIGRDSQRTPVTVG